METQSIKCPDCDGTGRKPQPKQERYLRFTHLAYSCETCKGQGVITDALTIWKIQHDFDRLRKQREFEAKVLPTGTRIKIVHDLCSKCDYEQCHCGKPDLPEGSLGTIRRNTYQLDTDYYQVVFDKWGADEGEICLSYADDDVTFTNFVVVSRPKVSEPQAQPIGKQLDMFGDEQTDAK